MVRQGERGGGGEIFMQSMMKYDNRSGWVAHSHSWAQ